MNDIVSLFAQPSNGNNLSKHGDKDNGIMTPTVIVVDDSRRRRRRRRKMQR